MSPGACALWQAKPPQWAACGLQLESSPRSPRLLKSPWSNRDPTQPKTNIYINKYFFLKKREHIWSQAALVRLHATHKLARWPWRVTVGIKWHHTSSAPRALPDTCRDHVHMWVLSCFSCVQLLSTPWTVAHQAPLSMELSRQEHWSGLPWPPPGDIPNPGIKPMSPTSPALAGEFFTTSAAWEAHWNDGWLP